MSRAEKIQIIQMKYRDMLPMFNERSRRYWAGAEAKALGNEGAMIVFQATGIAYNTVRAGLLELAHPK